MAAALVQRDLHLLLFSMLYDWQEEEEGGGERENGSRETSNVSSLPEQDRVESERDCE